MSRAGPRVRARVYQHAGRLQLLMQDWIRATLGRETVGEDDKYLSTSNLFILEGARTRAAASSTRPMGPSPGRRPSADT